MTPTSVIIEEPTKPAITVDSLKLHLRIDNNEEDGLLEAIIYAATARVEEYIDMKLIKQKWAIYWDSFLSKKKNEPWWDGTREMAIGELYNCNSKLDLPFGKVMGDDYSFSIMDGEGVYNVFDQSLYQVDGISKQSRIALKTGGTWPSTSAPMNGIKFEAYFGFNEDEDKLPHAIKQALLIFCASMYENKGDEPLDMPMPQATTMLLAPYRSIRIS